MSGTDVLSKRYLSHIANACDILIAAFYVCDMLQSLQECDTNR